MGKSLSVSPEINLLGKTVDEAVAELDKYLDDAYLAHLNLSVSFTEKEPEHSEKVFTISETPETCKSYPPWRIWRR